MPERSLRCSVAIAKAELFEDQEPQNDAGPSGTEEVLQPVPQAHAA